MRCNPWRWLWGLLLIAPLSWIALHLHQTEIENDLRARSIEALEGAGLGWASTSFSGRDATLRGLASEEGDPLMAADLVRRVWGVRVVEARTDLVKKIQSFVWSATRGAGGSLTLSGFVPGEASRRAVLNAVKATLPDLRVSDGMQLARGGPARAVFLSGVGFGLKQLAALKEGKVELAETRLSLSGVAPDQASLKAVRTRLKSLPAGITLGDEALRGPAVAPYAWGAAVASNQVALTGYVPSSEVRDQLFQETRKLFPRHAVVDRLEVADGAPDGFAGAALVGLQQLYQLKEGRAALSGRTIVLEGLAEDRDTAEAVRSAFVTQIGRSLAATADIRALEVPAVPAVAPEPVAAPAPEGPYVTRARIEDGQIELLGSVPSEDARIAVVAATRGRFPDLSVKDSLEVRAGGDPGWQACLLAGLTGLGRFVTGDLTMTGLELDLTGATDDDDVAAAVPGEVRGAASAGCNTAVNVTSTGEKQAEERRRAAEEARLAEETLRKAEEEARLAAEASAEAEARAAQARAEEEARLAATRAAAARCETLLGEVVAQGTINFKRADATLDSKSRPTLDKLARIANECPAFKISIEGHTDSEGIPERNDPLSERRAKAVLDYLVGAGVDPVRLSAVGYGADRPIADNETAEGRAQNRRIEFKVIAE